MITSYQSLKGEMHDGCGVRIFSNHCTRFEFMGHLLAIAALDSVCMEAMFDSVSGHKPYKEILLNSISFPLTVNMIR